MRLPAAFIAAVSAAALAAAEVVPTLAQQILAGPLSQAEAPLATLALERRQNGKRAPVVTVLVNDDDDNKTTSTSAAKSTSKAAVKTTSAQTTKQPAPTSDRSVKTTSATKKETTTTDTTSTSESTPTDLSTDSPTPTPTQSTNPSTGPAPLSSGAIAGIAAGSAVAILAGAIAYLFFRARSSRKATHDTVFSNKFGGAGSAVAPSDAELGRGSSGHPPMSSDAVGLLHDDPGAPGSGYGQGYEAYRGAVGVGGAGYSRLESGAEDSQTHPSHGQWMSPYDPPPQSGQSAGVPRIEVTGEHPR